MNQRILISGASIAGLTVAHWLARHGFRPTVLERAPACAPAATASTCATTPSMWPSGWASWRPSGQRPPTFRA
jgi:2-polyprenyl-6-methoxyphenol hydroxylase-like FAD-dependent oxidoreductase